MTDFSGTALITTALMITAFSLLPGLWIGYLLPLTPLRWYARLGLSVALSPAVVATQALILKAFSLPFAIIPTVLLFVNLLALVAVAWSIQREQRLAQLPRTTASDGGENAQATKSQRHDNILGGILGVGALLGLLLAYLAVPWRLVSGIRTFAWHALWHTDITYALTRNTLLPEEPELAGMRLSYGWFGHLFWSVTGWMTDLSPTVLYAVTNGIWLVVAIALGYAICRQGLRLSRPLALLGTGLIFLGTNTLGVLAWLYTRDWHWQQYYLGDLRYTPMLSKFLGFETMPFAFALLLCVILVSLVAIRRKIRNLALVLTILLSALGLIYPILFPAGAVVVGVMWLLLMARVDKRTPLYGQRALIWILIGGAISLVVTFGFMQIVTLDGDNAPIHLSALAAMKEKSFQVVTALLLFLPALLYLATTARRQLGTALLLTGGTIGLALLYIVADLEALEYKYVLAATMVAAPLAAAGIGRLLTDRRLQWIATAVILVGLVGANQLLMLRVGAQIPTNLVNAPTIEENGFWVHLAPTQAEAPWVTAIRTQTPENTVVVATDSHIHVSPFLLRSLYVPSDFDGTAIAGYSVDNRYNLLSWRGYSPAMFDARLATVAALFGGDSDRTRAAALTEMLALQRPLAIHMDAESDLETWLTATGIGSDLSIAPQTATAVTTDRVWLVEPTPTTFEQLERLDEHAAQ